jgi:hypothetical protein
MITFVSLFLCSLRGSRGTYLNGIRNIRAAFSWTCQPHRKLVIAASTSESKNRLYVGSNHSFVRYTQVNASVNANVILGVMFGKTPNMVVPTSPRDAELIASSETGQPRAAKSALAGVLAQRKGVRMRALLMNAHLTRTRSAAV